MLELVLSRTASGTHPPGDFREGLSDDLAQVPEVEFQAPPAREMDNQEALKATAHAMAKINHLNARKTDGFMAALRFERSDLAGLPFAMGDACRTKG